MAVGLVRRWAAAAPVPVFAVAGQDGLAAIEDLLAAPRLAPQVSPRHANILLVRGTIRDADRTALRRLHDQMPHPRATLWWGVPEPAFEHAPGRDDLLRMAADASPLAALDAAWHALMLDERPSEPDLLPNRPPHDWRGKGAHGQGGEGMMGGTPYGRPMAMTGDDLRDGLALDAYTTEMGPFLPMLPPGLVLRVTLQGDVLQQVEMLRPPYAQAGTTPLRRLARLLRLLGLPGLAQRVRRAESSGTVLERRLRRAGVFAALPSSLGLDEAVRAWCHGHPTAARRDTLERLPGLEWHEALLLVAVHPPPETGP